MFYSIWEFRGFIVSSVKRDFQSRYRNSLLGAIWTILNPLAMIFIYTVIFSKIMQARQPGLDSTFGYSIYLCSGIITWGLFAEIVNRSQNVFIEQGNIIKKILFPKICLPIIVVINSLINFGIIFGLFLVFLLIVGMFPGWIVFSLLPVLLLQICFTISLGIILGILNVFFRDVGQLVGVLLQFWFWFTPIVYPISIVPENIRKLLMLNPLAVIISTYQNVFVYKQAPNWLSLLPVFFLCLILSYVGLRLYRKRADEMVDEL